MKPDEAMRLALERARRAAGRTFPNPAVGAIVYRGDRILGRGATRAPGGDHAEIVALNSARRRFGARSLSGASMAVTLEPCCFTGRTGPCTEAILEAGIRRVAVGCRDPHPRVSGRGLRALRRAGLQVQVGVEAAACRQHHRGFFSLCERGRPFVILKLASSLDGRIATAKGESRWITGPAAREEVHRLRSRIDAVMVGSGTALADDPELSARLRGRIVHRPVRVLVDSRLRIPPSSKLFRGLRDRSGQPAAWRTWVLTRAGARGRRAIEATGARLVDVPSAGSHLDLEAGLQALGDAGLTSLLVEGGGELAAALLRANLVDEIQWFQAPTLLGGDARPALAGLGIERLSESLRLEAVEVRQVGSDRLTRGEIRTGAGSARRRTRQRSTK